MPNPEWKPDFDKMQKAWENAVREFPHLSSLGPSPLEDDGRFTKQALQAMRMAARYPTRSPLEGYASPEMQQVISGNLGIKGPAVPMPEAQAPPPVDWRQRGLDIAAPIAAVASKVLPSTALTTIPISHMASQEAKRREARGAMEVTPGFKPEQGPQDVMARRAEEVSRRKPKRQRMPWDPSAPDAPLMERVFKESRPGRAIESYRQTVLPIASIFFTGLKDEDIEDTALRPKWQIAGGPFRDWNRRLNNPSINNFYNKRAAEYKDQLMKQGYGPLAASQGAYQQALQEGHIPWWHTLIVEGILDPIEIVPMIGQLKYGPAVLRLIKKVKAPFRKLVKDTPSNIEEALVPPVQTKGQIETAAKKAGERQRVLKEGETVGEAEVAKRLESQAQARAIHTPASRVRVSRIVGKRGWAVNSLDDQGNVIRASTARTRAEAISDAKKTDSFTGEVDIYNSKGEFTKTLKARKGWESPEGVVMDDPLEGPLQPYQTRRPDAVTAPEVEETGKPAGIDRGFAEAPDTGVPDPVKRVDEVEEVAEEAVEMMPSAGVEDPAITDLLARIPEVKKGLYKNPEARARRIEKAERDVKEALGKAIEKVEEEASRFHPSWSPARGVDGLTARDLKKITDNTGASAAEVREAIRTAMTGVPVSSTEKVAELIRKSRESVSVEAVKAGIKAWRETSYKFVEQAWDDMWGVRQLGKQIMKAKLAKAGSQDDLENAVTLFAGNTQAVAARTENTVKAARNDMKGVMTRAGEAVDADETINDWLMIRHGQEVFRHKGKRKAVGPFTNKADLDNAERGIRAELGVEGIARLERASKRIIKLYADDLARYVDEGMVSADEAAELRRKYPYYSPLRYLEFIDDQLLAGKGRPKSVTDAVSPIGTLSPEGVEKSMATPLSVLTGELIRNEHRIRLNQLKRSMIRGYEELNKIRGDVSEVKKASSPVRLVATEGESKIFRRAKDPEGTMSFFENKEGVIGSHHYEVPKWMIRELEYLQEIHQPTGAAWALAAPNAVLRASFVTYNPSFIVANVLNDTFTVGMTRGVLPTSVGKELILGLGDALGRRFGIEAWRNPLWETATLGGGRQQKFYGRGPGDILGRNIGEDFQVDRGSFAQRVKHRIKRLHDPSLPTDLSAVEAKIDGRRVNAELIKKAGGTVVSPKQMADGMLGMAKALARAIPAVGEVGEMAPRVAAMRKSMNKDMPGWKMQLDSGAMTPQQLADTDQGRTAIQSGIDATINFSRGGRIIKQANKFWLFLNASMEGTKLPARAIARDPRLLAKTMGLTIVGQMGLTAYNMTQEGYYNIPLEERINSSFIIIPDSIAEHIPFLEAGKVDRYGDPIPARINFVPKLREWAVHMGLTTFLTEQVLGDNPDAVEDLVKAILPNATPLSVAAPFVPMPETAETITEISRGVDLYRGREIVPTELQHQPREKQVLPWTSPALKALSDSLEERVGMSISPLMLEHSYRAITGAVGGEVLSAVDMVYEMAQEDPDPTTQGYADRLKEAVGSLEKDKIYTEMIEAGMTEEERDEVYNLSVKPDARVPIVSSMVQRITGKSRGGEIQRTRRREAAEAAGLDEEQIAEASREAGKISRYEREDQIKKDRGEELRDGTQGPNIEAILNRKDQDGKYVDRGDVIIWRRDQSSGPGIRYRHTKDRLGREYPLSLYGATPEQKAIYYETLPTAGGTVEDVRTRGEVLTSGYYAIQPESGAGTEEETAYGMTDLDLMFRQREEYMNSLSQEDRLLLGEEIEKGRTPLQREYDKDVAYIRDTKFWDVYQIEADARGVGDAMREYNQTTGSSSRADLRKGNPKLAEALKAGAAKREEMRLYSYKEGLEGRPDGRLEDVLLKWGWYEVGIEEKQPSPLRTLTGGGGGIQRPQSSYYRQ